MITPPPRPVGVKAPHGATWFEVQWETGAPSRIPNRLLRGYCPCAGCQGHVGSVTFQAGHNSELRDIEQVGNYALRLVWGDGHGSGLYTFTFLKQLGELVATHGDSLPEVLPTLPPRLHAP